MKIGFYPKLAADGIRKNKRLYTPYILTSSGMVMMFYIIAFLSDCPTLNSIKGGGQVQYLMTLGKFVIGLFSFIFLFYTNSFLVRRRKKEFGLYNILGMGKKNIAIIIFWETLITAVVSLVSGLAAGILLSKIGELGMIRLMNGKVNFSFWISSQSVIYTLIVFGAVFLLLFLNSVRQVRFSSAITLIKSENAGEKAPKANPILGFGGLAVLIVAYYIAATVNNPFSAVLLFFIAVLMVIVATYLIMIFGSVLLCKILKSKKNYYYKPSHFVSVSSMAYRMKRNGAGLASICILATMVLVMISSTSCLYFGSEESLLRRYPGQINVEIRFHQERYNDETINASKETVKKLCDKYNTELSEVVDIKYGNVSGLYKGSSDITTNYNVDESGNIGYLTDFYFVNADDYFKLSGEKIELNGGEAYILTKDTTFTASSINFDFGASFNVVGSRVSEINSITESGLGSVPMFYIIVNDVLSEVGKYAANIEDDEVGAIRLCWEYSIDTTLDEERQIELKDEIIDEIDSQKQYKYLSVNSRANASGDFYGTYSGLFYLGIVLSFVFTIAAVLIIYYKQISEGYEDQSRFGIMRKVGMTKKEIRNSINSQILTVFFLPLLFAGLHLAFAFPMIRLLLTLFALYNVGLFALTTLISFASFALLYALVYKITSNAYYKIVSTDEQ